MDLSDSLPPEDDSNGSFGDTSLEGTIRNRSCADVVRGIPNRMQKGAQWRRKEMNSCSLHQVSRVIESPEGSLIDDSRVQKNAAIEGNQAITARFQRVRDELNLTHKKVIRSI